MRRAVVLPLLALPVLAQPARADATRIELDGVEDPCLITSPGQVTVAGRTVHVRGMTEECVLTSERPESNGVAYVVIDMDLDLQGMGPMSGTYVTVTDEGGRWEGSWHGLLSPAGSSISIVGRGVGLYDGMMQFLSVENGVGTGYMLIP